MPEAGGEFATYFDPMSLESGVDGLSRAFDALPSWPSRRQAAIERTRSFTWAKAATETLKAYRDAANG